MNVLKANQLRKYLSSVSVAWFIFMVFGFAYLQNTVLLANEGDLGAAIQRDSIAEWVESSAWDDRMKAAAHISVVMDADTLWAIKTIIRGIESEVASPSSKQNFLGTVTSYSNFLLQRYIDGLVALSQATTDTLYDRTDRYSGKVRSYLLIALAKLRDTRVHSQIRELIIYDPDPDVRAMAASSVWVYGDSLDIPLLLTAIKDTSGALLV